MIIDTILDRKYDCAYSKEDTRYMYNQSLIFGFDYLSRALDYGDNVDVQDALCRYIIENGYNQDICPYIRTQIWVENEF